MSLSVLSLNLWNDSEPFSERMAVVRRLIETRRPHLIGFQEIVRGDALDQFEVLVGGLDYETAFGPVVTFWKRDDLLFGNGIASAWPILDVKQTLLPRGDSTEQRGLLRASVEAPWGRVSFSTTHLDNRSPQNRALQVKTLVSHLATEALAHSYPPILVGDLNADRSAAELSALLACTHDACDEVGPAEAVTWSRSNPYTGGVGPEAERLDYILVGQSEAADRAGQALRSSIVFDRAEDGVWASDHLGLVAELEVPDP